MSSEFDPYHRWLGIRPDEQPADHYRLLGLARFEDDPEVIRDAAERQMGHVRRYALGQHTALCQRILNEIAAAKACLLDPLAKAQYVGTLQKAVAALLAAPVETRSLMTRLTPLWLHQQLAAWADEDRSWLRYLCLSLVVAGPLAWLGIFLYLLLLQ